MNHAALLQLIIILVKIFFLIAVFMTVVAYYTFGERIFSARMQLRVGPNRCGPWGLLQPLADGVKFFLKEDVIPTHVEKPLYVLAPLISFLPAMVTIAVVPFAEPVGPGIILGHHIPVIPVQIADINIGILYIFALASLGVYGVVTAGWASNNKYSLMGGLRASSQMISYELSMGMSIVGVLMVYETLRLNGIVAAQSGYISWLPFIPKWGIVVQPLAFVIFLVASFAETNRLPFDLPEGESEIVAGYHVEYGSMKFALFMMSEYCHMIVASAVITCLFFGGWQLPWVDMSAWRQIPRVLAQLGTFCGKTAFFMFFFIWIRWTIPRFRYDQLMRLGWKVLLPLAILNIFLTGLYYMIKYTIAAS